MTRAENALEVRKEDDLNLTTNFWEAKEYRWNNQSIKIDLKSAMKDHLSGGANPNIQKAKQTDLTQFTERLKAGGYLTAGYLGKLILPELNLLRGAFIDDLTLSKAGVQRKKASIKIWSDFPHLNFPR